MGYGETYGSLLEAIAEEADAIAMRYFRADELRIERKGDGTAVTQADRNVEEMARARVAGSGLAMDVLGEEMGGGDAQSASTSGRARMIIDPIDGTEEFSRGIPTFGTLIGIEVNGQIVAGMASAPGLGSRWWAYRGEGAYRNGKRIHVSSVDTLSRAMIFTAGTGPKKDPAMRAKLRLLSDMARNGRSIGGSGSTCLSPRAQRKLRWTLPLSHGILPRWELSWRRRGAARRICVARGRSIRGSSSARTERFTTRC